MKRVWLLYSREDLAVNRDFAAMMTRLGAARGLDIHPVVLNELTLAMTGQGVPQLFYNGCLAHPDAVLSRMRCSLYSHHFEAMGVPVFNGAKVCEICNDKRRTHQFLAGLPMPTTRFLTEDSKAADRYPMVVKPACSHGGDRVAMVSDAERWREAADSILPQAALEQRVVSEAGKDLRVYVVFGKIVAAVMRTANSGIVSNFKLGGSVKLHTLTVAEKMLAERVIQRFADADAPLCFAGVDMLYDEQWPVVSEVEDVVGSRMLYQTSDIDIAALFLDGFLQTV